MVEVWPFIRNTRRRPGFGRKISSVLAMLSLRCLYNTQIETLSGSSMQEADYCERGEDWK